jgi:4'-phosphopantetheinyl transferase
MRKAVSHITGIPYRDICLGRTDKGKPFLTNALPPGFNFDFNISHDGDYAVLAAETGHSVGVDTVQLGRTR